MASTQYKLDTADIKILQFLQHDASMTRREIAKKLGKTISPVNDRINRLQQLGFIEKYVALLDHHKMGRGLTAFTSVKLKQHSESMMRSFERQIINVEEVMECYHMTGQYDFFLKVILRDMQDYYHFVVNKLAKLANVGTVQSIFVLHASKIETALKIDKKS